MTTYAEGVDFANQRPSGVALRRAGKDFVVRYLSPNTRNNPRKLLTAAEVDEYHGADLSICLVWETGTDRARLGGHAGGVSDARAAAFAAALLGAPLDQAIYFAVDEDTTGPAVDPYFQGVADAIGLARTGAYGGRKPISWLFDHGRITYGWQTYAWSGGQWDPRAQARQYDNGASVPGAGSGYDLDRAVHPQYGQWAPPGSPGDVEIDMTDVNVVSFSAAAQAALVQALLTANVAAVPTDEQGGAGLTVRGSLRQTAGRTDTLANVDYPATAAALANLDTEVDGITNAEQSAADALRTLLAKLDGIPAAVVAALPTGAEGGWLTPAQVTDACVAALGHLGLVVAP